MIVWVDEMLRSWGRAKRRINGIPDIKLPDGTLPSGRVKSFVGKLKDGCHVMNDKKQVRPAEPLEVLLGPALIASVAIQTALTAKTIREKHYELLYVHYVLRASGRKKRKALKMDRVTYGEALHSIHNKLISSIEAAAGTYENLSKIA